MLIFFTFLFSACFMSFFLVSFSFKKHQIIIVIIIIMIIIIIIIIIIIYNRQT